MTRAITLIGLTGFAGHGKDTARSILEEHGFIGLAFADPIRQMIRQLLDSAGIDTDCMDVRELKESTIPELGVSYRQMAQTLGTEWGRSLHPDIWLRLADAFISDCYDADTFNTHFVVSDVRFPNEADWVRERGGVIWRVARPGIEAVRPHASESSVDLITPDLVIDNTGTIDDLHAAVERALHTLT